ncbi:nuclear transport factor 2 family protein [Rhodanobacter sp. 115]|uniref:hypothetical protein n=1 Tax=Rhodanobacter sp. FW021-MT20 TaxID=1162282 RepID=UPI000260DF83|nr:hypothetical protein [Rhodanobacter sp. 115]EIL90902.1 hypothetical protein UU5_14568 [Rhodanobacter sp. 115]
MNTRTVLHPTGFGLAVCLIATACAASPSRHSRTDDAAWLTRTLITRESALSSAYNTCHLHALRDAVFAGTRIRLQNGRRIDPVREARDHICNHLHRQVTPDSVAVRAVGDDSALVTGTQRFCAIGVTPCTAPGSHFAHLWTLDRGHWRMGWMRRDPIH